MTTRDLVAVTVVGKDRKGIVAAVTEALYEAGCNLLDATSTILRGHFSMMLIVAPPQGSTAAVLEERLGDVATALELSITARPVQEAGSELPRPTHMVAVYGADQPGIVFRVTKHLAESGANITALSSRLIGSEERPVYALMLEVVSDGDIEADVDAIREEIGMDVSVHPIDSDVL